LFVYLADGVGGRIFLVSGITQYSGTHITSLRRANPA
jgi:hypothetical protein